MRFMILTMLMFFALPMFGQAQTFTPTPMPALSTAAAQRPDGAVDANATAEIIQQPAATPTPNLFEQTGAIHTVGEDIPVVDATADPNATPTSTPRSPADLTAIAVRQTAAPAAGPSGGDPLEQTGAVHTVGEGLFDIDAAATALHQMIHSPDAPAFRSICDLPPRSPADVVACEAYKAAYRLKHGNPCRHNDEGEAVCLH